MSSIASHSESVSAPRLPERVEGRIRFKHCSTRTGQAYVQWIKRYIISNEKNGVYRSHRYRSSSACFSSA